MEVAAPARRRRRRRDLLEERRFLAPALIAREARRLYGPAQERALDAYAKARELATIAPRVSLDPAATVFQLGGILAEVAS